MTSTGYPLHSPVSPSLPLPCVTVCHHISTVFYHVLSTNMDVSPFINSTDQNGNSLIVSVLAMVFSCQSLDGVYVTKRHRKHYIYWFLFRMSCFNCQPSLPCFFTWLFDSIFRVVVSLHRASQSHSLDAPQSVGVLWTSGQPDA